MASQTDLERAEAQIVRLLVIVEGQADLIAQLTDQLATLRTTGIDGADDGAVIPRHR